MRIFPSSVSAVKEIERDVAEMGHRVSTKTYQDKVVGDNPDFETREILGYSFTLLDGNDWMMTFAELGMKKPLDCISYVEAEVNARIDIGLQTAAMNPGVSFTRRRDIWDQFLEKDGKFSYTYPERLHSFNIHHRSQITSISNLHGADSGSRQLVMPIYNAQLDNENRGGKRRIPCTMHYQVFDRSDQLTLLQSMRSLDLYTHLAIDLSIAWGMAVFLTDLWGMKVSPSVLFQVGSLHAFRKDIETRRVF